MAIMLRIKDLFKKSLVSPAGLLQFILFFPYLAAKSDAASRPVISGFIKDQSSCGGIVDWER